MSYRAFTIGKQLAFFFLPPDSWNSYLGRYCKVNDVFNDVYDNFAGFIATV